MHVCEIVTGDGRSFCVSCDGKEAFSTIINNISFIQVIYSLAQESCSMYIPLLPWHVGMNTSSFNIIIILLIFTASLKDECSTCKIVLGFVKTLLEDYNVC